MQKIKRTVERCKTSKQLNNQPKIIFQTLYKMQCDTNPIRLLFLMIFLAVIVCLMKWNKSADFVKHRPTENKFHRYEQSDTKENHNPYQQTFCDLDR